MSALGPNGISSTINLKKENSNDLLNSSSSSPIVNENNNDIIVRETFVQGLASTMLGLKDNSGVIDTTIQENNSIEKDTDVEMLNNNSTTTGQLQQQQQSSSTNSQKKKKNNNKKK